jgi:sulfonate dioxygenase
LNYNPLFVTKIKELEGRESSHILSFLHEHLNTADDLSVRWKWAPGSIAFWDNRVIAHRAIPGGYDPSTREGKRTAIFGERPFFDPTKSESFSERRDRLVAEANAVGVPQNDNDLDIKKSVEAITSELDKFPVN